MTDLILVSAMGLWDIPEEMSSWIYGTGLRRKIGVRVGCPGRFEIYR